MKPLIVYDSWLAKTFLFPNYSTIMLLGMVFSKLSFSQMVPRIRVHESIHCYQYFECAVLGAVIMSVVILLTDISWWWILTSLLTFYVLYLVEWIISFIYHLFFDSKRDPISDENKQTYYASALEMEAKENESDPRYLDNRWFKYKFFKYYGKI